MITIALDAMGGDHAPDVTIEAAKVFLEEVPNVKVKLFGDEAVLRAKLQANDRLEIIPTTEIVTGEDEPVKAIRGKKDSSMVRAAQAVKDGEADAIVSAGNTGALLTAGLLVVGRIKNIGRPGLAPLLPVVSGNLGSRFILMDAGANADTKAENMRQFAILGSYYAAKVLDIPNPRVGLINNGTEAGKGSALSQAAYDLLAEEASINFIGNVESRNLLEGVCDVAVTDGFTGNAVLKAIEGAASAIVRLLKDKIMGGSTKAKLGGAMLKDTLKGMAKDVDTSEFGGAVLLGVKAPVIKTHGSSDARAIVNAMKQAVTIIESGFVQEATDFFANE